MLTSGCAVPVRWALALICLCCCTTAGFAQSSLTVTPQQVSLAAPVGSTTPVETRVTIGVGGSATAYTASVQYLSGGSGWLAITPVTGNAPAALTVSATPGAQTIGTSIALVNITAGSLSTSVRVLFTVGTGPGTGSTRRQLVTSATSLTFFGQQGSALPQTQTLSVERAAGASSGAYTAFATSSSNWLTVSPAAGTAPATLQVMATQTGLAGGIYTGTVTLVPAGGGEPTVVPVTLVSSGSGTVTPELLVSQTAIHVNHQFGAPEPPYQSLPLYNSLGIFQEYAASTTTSWLRLSNANSPTPAMSLTGVMPGELQVSFVTSGLAPGSYSGSVSITAAGLSATIPVTLTVSTSTSLNANPSSLYLDDIFGILSAGIVVTGTGSANLAFTAASSAPWLSVSPTSGSTSSGSQFLSVFSSTAGLGGGMYTGSITLTVTGTGQTLVIPVTLRVRRAADIGSVQVLTQGIELSSLAGDANPSTVLEVFSSSGVPHAFTASARSSGGWLSVDPFSATAHARLSVTADAAAVAAGSYDGSIVLTSLVNGQQQTIPVVFRLAAPAISATPASLSFTQQQRGTPPAAQTVQVTGTVPSTFDVSTSASWIRVSPLRTGTPATLTVTVDPSGLAPGLNSGTIRLVGPNNQLSIPVSLTVAEAPVPTAEPASLTFTYQLGSPAPAAQSLTIGSALGALNYNARVTTASGVDWLRVTPLAGVTPANMVVNVDTTRLVPGRHAGAIILGTDDPDSQPRTVPVTLTVGSTNVEPQQVLNAATLLPTAIAPGLIVSIKGSGLGPPIGVTARPSAAGAIDTRLEDIRVTFDGIPAPLLFVRFDQINAIVPYSISGRVSARMQVESGTSFSIPIELRVVDVAPGILTTGGTGRGQAAALNQDLTPNAVSNPADRGAVVVIYGTGEGQTNPQGQDGRIIATDLRSPLVPVTATIGGKPADVLYLGSASSLVSGVFQANLRIPQDIEPGRVPVEIQIGGVATQGDVSIVVR